MSPGNTLQMSFAATDGWTRMHPGMEMPAGLPLKGSLVYVDE